MQLPDEAINYQFQSLLFQPTPEDEWRPHQELQAQHFLHPNRLKSFLPQLHQVRSQVASEREVLTMPVVNHRQLEPGFIDLPLRLLEEFRRSPQNSELGRIVSTGNRLRELVDRVVILGAGGSTGAARALFGALRSCHHNELPAESRMGTPRVYFDGDSLDNDALQDLLEVLQTTCVNPDDRAERWGSIVISKSGKTMESAVALRVFRREAAEYYGSRSPWVRDVIVPVTGPDDSPLRALARADGYDDAEIFGMPDRVGGRFSVFTAAGLLPAVVMGLDVRAMLLGAASMTRQFLEEPFERNPVLQFAAVNYLMTEEHGKPIRVLACWSRKLEALGHWYDHLVAESLGKQGRGPTPITVVHPRDLHFRGQQHLQGRRDKLIINLVVKNTRSSPVPIGMADRNEDQLNSLSRKGIPDLQEAALRSTAEACRDGARPAAEIALPVLNEHVIGQLMQMLMLATVVEGRLMGVNPYGQPGLEEYKRHMQALLQPPAKPGPTPVRAAMERRG